MITQKTVKSIARAFGFSAVWSVEFQEWRIASKKYPNDSYFTGEHDDAIGTILESYRFYRSHNQIQSIS